MPGNGQRKTDCGVNTMDRSERMRKPGTMQGNPYESKGALLYMVCRHVVRPAELPRSQYPNVEPGCVTCVPYKGLHPLRRFAAILANLGNKQGSYEPYLFPKSFYSNLKSKEEHFYVSKKSRA